MATIPKHVIANSSLIVTLKKEELALIPKDYLIDCFERYIRYIYQDLSDELQNDADIILCLPCIHHNLPESKDHIDGPACARKYCKNCVDFFYVN